MLVPALTPKLLPVVCADPAASVWPWLVLLPLDVPSDVPQLVPSVCAVLALALSVCAQLSVWLPESVWAALSVCAQLSVCAPETVLAALSVSFK